MSELPARHSIISGINIKNIIAVPSTTIDSVAASMGFHKVDFIKNDVEGAEPHVLEGARKIIETSKDLQIVMEFTCEEWRDHQKLLQYLFQTFEVFEVKRSPFLLERVNIELVKEGPRRHLYFRR